MESRAQMSKVGTSLAARYSPTDPNVIAKCAFPKPTSTRSGAEFLHINVYGLSLLVLSENSATVLFPKGGKVDAHELFVSKVEDNSAPMRLSGFEGTLISVKGQTPAGTATQTISANEQSAPFQTLDSLLDARRAVGQRELKSFRKMLDEECLNGALTIESPFIEIGAPFSPFGWLCLWDINGQEVICTDNFYLIVPIQQDGFAFSLDPFETEGPRQPRRVAPEPRDKKTVEPLQYSFANVDQCLDKSPERRLRLQPEVPVLNEVVHVYNLFQRVSHPETLPMPTLSRSFANWSHTDKALTEFIRLGMMSSCSSPVCSGLFCYQPSWQPRIELQPE
jgi:hypothetical protein